MAVAPNITHNTMMAASGHTGAAWLITKDDNPIMMPSAPSTRRELPTASATTALTT